MSCPRCASLQSLSDKPYLPFRGSVTAVTPQPAPPRLAGRNHAFPPRKVLKNRRNMAWHVSCCTKQYMAVYLHVEFEIHTTALLFIRGFCGKILHAICYYTASVFVTVDTTTYRLSFTFGGLLIPETRTIAQQYQEIGDWDLVRVRVLSENLLQKTRQSSSYRYFREVRCRFDAAQSWEIELLADNAASDTDHALVSLAIVSRYYRLIGDFLTTVVRERLVEGLDRMDVALVKTFMAEQETIHPAIGDLALSTREKLASVVVRVLTEARVAVGTRNALRLERPSMTPRLRELYCAYGNEADHHHLLWTDKEMHPCIQ
ncbi:MAG: DUF1819 family protein [Spirochaetaceae bacterium]|nr:MAG: DUF1819 family protein [Spirochaetaceae bacterium]